jgi:predicted RNA-binding Zn ribbon-like protein
MASDHAKGAPVMGEPLPVEFMNTIWADRAGIHDALGTEEDARSWLRSVSPRLAPSGDDLGSWLERPADFPATLEQLRLLRDAMRRLAAEQTADPRERASSPVVDLDDALATVNNAAAAAPHWSRLHWHPGAGLRRETHTAAGPEAAMGGILAEQAVDLFSSETVGQLRACLGPGCVLYFVKQHQRREWCSAACGNRARAARHYQRHRRGA